MNTATLTETVVVSQYRIVAFVLYQFTRFVGKLTRIVQPQVCYAAIPIEAA